jgi:hypothetical protein
MTARESEPQKETIERVMHEYKHGELRSGTSGQKVKNRKQAVAIALSEAGASDQQTPKENEGHLRHTKARSAAAKRQRMKPKARLDAGCPHGSGPEVRPRY